MSCTDTGGFEITQSCKMSNSDLTDFVTRHSFRMCSFVHVEKHDLYVAKVINPAETGTGGPSVFYSQKWEDKGGITGQNVQCVQCG